MGEILTSFQCVLFLASHKILRTPTQNPSYTYYRSNFTYPYQVASITNTLYDVQRACLLRQCIC